MMDRVEVKKLLYVVRANYKRHFDNYSQEDFENLAIAWGMCLEGYTYEQASQGLKAFMVSDTKGFPPVVGQIIDQISKLDKSNEIMGAMEAWGLVYKAVCNSTYNADTEFAKLPPLCQKVVGNPSNLKEMASMEMDTVKSVEQSHFIRQYNTAAEREKEIQKLPPSMRIALDVAERKLIE
jgi:hypothetical protein